MITDPRTVRAMTRHGWIVWNPTVTLEIPTDAEYHATHPNGTRGVASGMRFTAGDGDVRAEGVVMPCRL